MSTEQVDVGNASLEALVSKLDKEFLARFGRSPQELVAAPGRVNLIGEHIDYNDGYVMPMAIERYVVMAASPRTESSGQDLVVHSVNLSETVTIPLGTRSHPESEGWARYIEGVAAGFADLEIALPPLDVAFTSNVPLGGGLSSSAALEVAAATLLESVTGQRLDGVDKALLCQHAEHHFAGVPCGIMDQFSSVFGKPSELMLIDCRSQHLQPVHFVASDIAVLVTNSNVKHALASGEYAKRRSQCDSALSKLQHVSWRDVTLEDLVSSRADLTGDEFRRGRHVVSEIARTLEAADAFERQDWSRVGQLMYASHDSLRDDYEVTCRELDVLVDIARGIGESGGIIGSRMTGGGFGGCTVSLVATDRIESVIDSFTTQYESKTGRKPSCFATQPARGAHVIRSMA